MPIGFGIGLGFQPTVPPTGGPIAPPPPSTSILASGAWNDTGAWDDTSTWKDNA